MGWAKDRFGVLTLAWALIGYASLFDIGLGRAANATGGQETGERGRPRDSRAGVDVLTIMLALGAAGSVAILAISPWLVHHALKDRRITGGLRAFFNPLGWRFQRS